MPTTRGIDRGLVLEAQKLGHHRTASDAVIAALEEYIRRRKQLDILRLLGTIDYHDSYNYKRERKSKKTNLI